MFLSRYNRRIWITIFLVGGSILLGIFSAFLCYSAEASEHVVINEVCSNNFSVISAENDEYHDYVELYNPAAVPVSLTGFSLSDSEIELQKCSLETVIIMPKSYYIVWLDGAGKEYVGHSDFKLSKTGESLYFSNKNGKIIDSVEMPEMQYNTSYARVRDGQGQWDRMDPTPGNTNDNAKVLPTVACEMPVFSVESGFYEEQVTLEIIVEDEEEIYYTLDGSTPTTQSTKYEAPIVITDASNKENVYSARTDVSIEYNYIPVEKVDKATIVRAIAYNPVDGTVSEVKTASYFVDFAKKTEYENYAVLSLVCDPDSLFEEEYGIYHIANANKRGKQWEREASIAYFDTTHEYQFTQEVGIRISGESTRNYNQKSFNIFARDIYDGKNVLEYDFFEGVEYSSVKLRNGGSSSQKIGIVDSFLQSLAKDRAVAVQDSKLTVVFINGEYWGIYNIRERYKEDYFENHYGVDAGNILMIDSGRISIGSWEAYNTYQEMLKFVEENDMSQDEMYEQACQLLDMQSLIDFYCIQLYVDNKDMGFDKNIALWRSAKVGDSEYEDGRWRFMLYDMDGAVNHPENNSFKDIIWWKENFTLMDEVLISNLMENENFRQQFYDTFIEISETTFAYENVHEQLMEWKERYQVQTVERNQRFSSAQASVEEYQQYIDSIDQFFQKRSDYIIPYLEEEMRGYNE